MVQVLIAVAVANLPGDYTFRNAAPYQGEAPQVRSHLHLMAIQKMVYSRLNRPEMRL